MQREGGDEMKIVILGKPKEIAALAAETQERQFRQMLTVQGHYQTIQSLEGDVQFWRERAEKGEGEYKPAYSYEWDGRGLVVTRLADGKDCYIQGDDGADVYAVLDNTREEYRADLILSDYDVLMDPDD